MFQCEHCFLHVEDVDSHRAQRQEAEQNRNFTTGFQLHLSLGHSTYRRFRFFICLPLDELNLQSKRSF